MTPRFQAGQLDGAKELCSPGGKGSGDYGNQEFGFGYIKFEILNTYY